jgi:hypothetical protein
VNIKKIVLALLLAAGFALGADAQADSGNSGEVLTMDKDGKVVLTDKDSKPIKNSGKSAGSDAKGAKKQSKKSKNSK